MDFLVFANVDSVDTLVMLDLGNVAPASSDDSRLRIDNPDDTYRAEDVAVTITGTDASQLWLSLDGDNYSAAINVGDIDPNGSSDTFWLRRVTPSDATVSGHAVIAATPAAWSIPDDTSSSGNVALET